MRTSQELNEHPGWRDISAAGATYVSAWKSRGVGGDIVCSSVVRFFGVNDASCAVVVMPQGAIVMAETVSDIEHGMALCDRFVDRQMAATISA